MSVTPQSVQGWTCLRHSLLCRVAWDLGAACCMHATLAMATETCCCIMWQCVNFMKLVCAAGTKKTAFHARTNAEGLTSDDTDRVVGASRFWVACW